MTGDIWEGIYADDCLFVDPTVTFRGESSCIAAVRAEHATLA